MKKNDVKMRESALEYPRTNRLFKVRLNLNYGRTVVLLLTLDLYDVLTLDERIF